MKNLSISDRYVSKGDKVMKTLVVGILGCFLLACGPPKVAKPPVFTGEDAICAKVFKQFEKILQTNAETMPSEQPGVVSAAVEILSASCVGDNAAKVTFSISVVVGKVDAEKDTQLYCVVQEATAIVTLLGNELEVTVIDLVPVSADLCKNQPAKKV